MSQDQPRKLKVAGLQPVGAFKRMVQEQQAGGAAPRHNKYDSVAVTNGLGQFDSKHEANWAQQLTLLQQQGYIKNLRLMKCDLRFALDVNGTRICDYEADARFDAAQDCELSRDPQHRLEAGKHYVCDAKSPPTRKKEGFVIKKKLMHAIHGIDIVEL